MSNAWGWAGTAQQFLTTSPTAWPDQFVGSLLEAKVLTDERLIDFNTNRTHSGLGRNTPAQFAAD